MKGDPSLLSPDTQVPMHLVEPMSAVVDADVSTLVSVANNRTIEYPTTFPLTVVKSTSIFAPGTKSRVFS
jgi:hypothetical protein